MRIDGNEQSAIHQARVLVVMDPRDVHPENADYGLREPDLILTFDLRSFERNLKVIEELHRGDLIRFNATITHLAIRRPS